jgi:hypothetical protein
LLPVPNEQIASNGPVYALSGQLQHLNEGNTPRYPRVILALFLALSVVIPYQLLRTETGWEGDAPGEVSLDRAFD